MKREPKEKAATEVKRKTISRKASPAAEEAPKAKPARRTTRTKVSAKAQAAPAPEREPEPESTLQRDHLTTLERIRGSAARFAPNELVHSSFGDGDFSFHGLQRPKNISQKQWKVVRATSTIAALNRETARILHERAQQERNARRLAKVPTAAMEAVAKRKGA